MMLTNKPAFFLSNSKKQDINIPELFLNPPWVKLEEEKKEALLKEPETTQLLLSQNNFEEISAITLVELDELLKNSEKIQWVKTTVKLPLLVFFKLNDTDRRQLLNHAPHINQLVNDEELLLSVLLVREASISSPIVLPIIPTITADEKKILIASLKNFTEALKVNIVSHFCGANFVESGLFVKRLLILDADLIHEILTPPSIKLPRLVAALRSQQSTERPLDAVLNDVLKLGPDVRKAVFFPVESNHRARSLIKAGIPLLTLKNIAQINAFINEYEEVIELTKKGLTIEDLSLPDVLENLMVLNFLVDVARLNLISFLQLPEGERREIYKAEATLEDLAKKYDFFADDLITFEHGTRKALLSRAGPELKKLKMLHPINELTKEKWPIIEQLIKYHNRIKNLKDHFNYPVSQLLKEEPSIREELLTTDNLELVLCSMKDDLAPDQPVPNLLALDPDVRQLLYNHNEAIKNLKLSYQELSTRTADDLNEAIHRNNQRFCNGM